MFPSETGASILWLFLENCQSKVHSEEHVSGCVSPLRILKEYSCIFLCRRWHFCSCKCLRVPLRSREADPRLPGMKGCISLCQCLYPGTNWSGWVRWSRGKSLLKRENAVLIQPNKQICSVLRRKPLSGIWRETDSFSCLLCLKLEYNNIAAGMCQ